MSSNNRYNIYLRQVQDLAETLVIKSEITADCINTELTRFGPAGIVDEFDLGSWKYYKHLAGEYYGTDPAIYGTDQRMIVASMDTMELIEFNKTNLAMHKATYTAYQYGTRQYKELVDKYPTQERLILGILYPCDIVEAVTAPDNAILCWPSHLIESNEYTLIAKIGEWINRYHARWDNAQYTITDELYKATQLGVMYLNLVPTILNLRLAACRTNEAHSFHVFHYLASHGFSEYFFQFFTTAQTLFFYRNISYIEHNSGSRDNLDWLVEKVMTERKLPIAEFTMGHDLTLMKETGIESLTPAIVLRRNALNMATQQLGPDVRDLSTMLIKEDPLARDNITNRVVDTPVIAALMTYATKNVLPTKVLESYVVDYSNSAVYPFEWIMLNHWIYCAHNDLTKNYVIINSPKTGERITLSSKEAVVLYFYAYFASLNVTLKVPPSVVVSRVTREVKPTLAELMRTIDGTVFTEDKVDFIRVRQPLLRPTVSSQAFYDFGRALYAYEEWQVRFIAMQDGRLQRAYAKSTINSMYSDSLVNLSTDFTGTYTQWFAERNINIDTFTTDDFTTLFTSIFKTATGMYNSVHVTTRSIQRAMLDVMQQLSSYSVQYIADITDSNIVFTNLDSVRLDTILHVMNGNLFGGEPNIVVKDLKPEKFDLNHLNAQTRLHDIGTVAAGSVRTATDSAISLENNCFFYEQRLNLSGVTVGVDVEPSTDPAVFAVPGVELTYNILSQPQRAMILNAYFARGFVDNNLYGISIPKKTYTSFQPFSIAKRIYKSSMIDPASTVARSERQYKVQLETPVPYTWSSLAYASVPVFNCELAHADLAKVYGPFTVTSEINPWETITLNQPTLNALTLSASDSAKLLNRIILSTTY